MYQFKSGKNRDCRQLLHLLWRHGPWHGQPQLLSAAGRFGRGWHARVVERRHERRTRFGVADKQANTTVANTKAGQARLKYRCQTCLLYTSDAADEEDSVDLG